MEISDVVSGYMAQNLASIQSAASTAMLSKAMNQDAQTVADLLGGLEDTAAMERSVNPSVGANFDALV
ncbi:hypothetical protein FACS18949_02520 [Clostridia bacterium]|nr:hypothetical protein FACS18949_02520 [Clostridia bacterium]